MEAKIAFVDLEISPSLGYVYGKWDTNVLEFEKDWFVMSFAVKWAGQKKVKVHSLPHFKSYKNHPEDDYLLIKELRDVLDKADMVVWHNGDRFDAKKANSRFLLHGLTEPSPYDSYDTLRTLRNKFGFTSNSLNDICKTLGIGRKTDVKHSDIWRKCIQGDKKSWDLMEKYNAMDVILLEKLYYKIRSWGKHPVVSWVNCPVCGGQTVKRGQERRGMFHVQRLSCKNCGKWSSGEKFKVQ